MHRILAWLRATQTLGPVRARRMHSRRSNQYEVISKVITLLRGNKNQVAQGTHQVLILSPDPPKQLLTGSGQTET